MKVDDTVEEIRRPCGRGTRWQGRPRKEGFMRTVQVQICLMC